MNDQYLQIHFQLAEPTGTYNAVQIDMIQCQTFLHLELYIGIQDDEVAHKQCMIVHADMCVVVYIDV